MLLFGFSLKPGSQILLLGGFVVVLLILVCTKRHNLFDGRTWGIYQHPNISPKGEEFRS